MEWIAEGICTPVTHHYFFSDERLDQKIAKGICRDCPVISECFEYAFKIDAWGVWGGTTKKERDRIRNRRYINRFKKLAEPVDVLPHSNKYEPQRPTYAFPSFPSHTSSLDIRTQQALLKLVAIQFPSPPVDRAS
jgi:WhiB family redox-sensing transcriptional regulator